MAKSAKIIEQLNSVRGLKVQCPTCSESFPIKKAHLFSMHEPYPSHVLNILKRRVEETQVHIESLRSRNAKLQEDIHKRPRKISISAEASNFGKISEQILPAFVTFPYNQSECRVLLSPIDYTVFVGLSKKDSVDSIKFVEVKTGKGRLDKNQEAIRNCVVEGKIKHTVIEYERADSNN